MIPATENIMVWRVALQPRKGALEVINPSDWEQLTTEQQSTYQSVSLFGSEQEADRFARDQVDAAKSASPKLRSR
jgi:hypothetical protein